MRLRVDLLESLVLKGVVLILSYMFPLPIAESLGWDLNKVLWISGFIGCLICCLIDRITNFDENINNRAYSYEHIIFKYEYIIITESYLHDRKTPILTIYNMKGIRLGYIKWYKTSKKFCLYPDSETVWDNKCLSEVITFLNSYNEKWRKIKRNER